MQASAAPVAVGSLIRSQATEMIRLSGVDRVYNGTLYTTLRPQTLLFESLITAGSFRRLATVAKAYQRIRFTQLRFSVEPQMPTSTAGGYVAAFVRDAADELHDIDSVTATQGSVTTKWWQGSTVSAPLPKRLLYTSTSKEVREYSPGKLVVWNDGPPTQNGSLTVFCHWSVELSEAGLETPAAVVVDVTALSTGMSGRPTRAFGRRG